jgi:hypothetical protein
VYSLPVAKQHENTNACIKMLKLYFADIKQLAIAEHFNVSNFKFCTDSFLADYITNYHVSTEKCTDNVI